MRKILFKRMLAVALASTLAGVVHAQSVEIDASSDDTSTSPNLGLRLRPAAPAARLRCWQRGMLIVDEPLAAASRPSGTPLIAATGEQRQALAVFAAASGLCLLSNTVPSTSSSGR